MVHWIGPRTVPKRLSAFVEFQFQTMLCNQRVGLRKAFLAPGKSSLLRPRCRVVRRSRYCIRPVSLGYRRPRPRVKTSPTVLPRREISLNAHSDVPPSEGLFNPANDRDSCGVGFIGELSKRPTRRCVEDALEMLRRMTHRGACGCEENSGQIWQI